MTFRNQRRTSGFTLLEVIVTLVIIGVIVGLASVNFQPSEKNRLENEARRIALLLELTAEEALTTGKPIGFSVNESGYLFVTRDSKGKWIPMRIDSMLHGGDFARGITAEEFSVGLENELSEQSARIIYYPTGEASIFSITFRSGADRVTISGDPIGNVFMELDES